MTMILPPRFRHGVPFIMLLLLFVVAVTGCTRQTLAPAGRPELFDTQWRAVRAAGKDVGFLEGQKLDVSMVLYKGGHFRGSGGCNSFSGKSSLKGSSIRLPVMASTRMVCTPEVMAQERRFLNALRAASTWSIEGGRLVLRDMKGRVSVEFIPLR